MLVGGCSHLTLNARLLHADQFHESPRNIPVLDIQIAIFVPIRAVRSIKDAFNPLILRHIEVAAGFRVRIVTEDGHDGVALVENDDAAMKIGDRDVITLNGYGRWHAQTGDDFFDKVSIQIVVEQSALGCVIAIADQQARRIVTRVQRHAMRSVELLQCVPFHAKVHQVFTVFVEFENVVAGVTV